MKVADVEATDYAAIYLAGGHGAMFDFAESHDLATLVADFYEANKIVSAVCHGPGGLLNVRLRGGDALIAGKKLTGFSWAEEKGVKRDDAVPFSLEDRLRDVGADYSKALIPFASHVVEDGRLITGQNPGSARSWRRSRRTASGRGRSSPSARIGACTVLIDGTRTNACLKLAAPLDGRAITTIEGVGQAGNLHPRQAAFVEHDALPADVRERRVRRRRTRDG